LHERGRLSVTVIVVLVNGLESGIWGKEAIGQLSNAYMLALTCMSATVK
jgi:hypothetical protein